MQRIARIAAATFVLVGGSVHLELWRSGYRGIQYIGPLFVANIATSALLVVALLVRADVRVAAAGIAFSVGSLVALVLSRTTGLLGFTEKVWTDLAVQATTAELGAIVAMALLVVARARPVPALATLPLRFDVQGHGPREVVDGLSKGPSLERYAGHAGAEWEVSTASRRPPCSGPRSSDRWSCGLHFHCVVRSSFGRDVRWGRHGSSRDWTPPGRQWAGGVQFTVGSEGPPRIPAETGGPVGSSFSLVSGLGGPWPARPPGRTAAPRGDEPGR